MKTFSPNQTEPSRLAMRGLRAGSSFQLAPASQSVDPACRLSTDESEAETVTQASAQNAKIQNFSFFAPAATSVQLVGCFTHWQKQPINLRKSANGVWWTAIRLVRGTYYYRFLVDGQWRDDPECPLVVPNPFGCLNAVRQVN